MPSVAQDGESEDRAPACSSAGSQAGYGHLPAATSTRQLATASEDYLNYLETEHRAPKTLVKYRGILTTLVSFLAEMDVTRVAQFTATHFDRFRAIRKPEVHRKTLYMESVVVKQFLEWCKSRNLIAESPIAEFKLNKPLLEPK